MESIVTKDNYSPLNEMRLLSNNQLHNESLSTLNGKDTENQAKLFLIAQARNELQRIVKMTEYLDRLENKFMNVVNKKLVEQPTNLNLIMTAMDITQQSLKRSNELVNQILKDDTLQTLVLNTVNIIPGVENSTAIDMDSRESIRSVAANLISQLKSKEAEIVEVDVVNADTSINNNVEGNNVESDGITNEQ